MVDTQDIEKDDKNRFTTRAQGTWSWIGDATVPNGQNAWSVDANVDTAVDQALQEKTDGDRVGTWFNYNHVLGALVKEELNYFLFPWLTQVNGQWIINENHR